MVLNLDGGVTLDSDALRELRELERETGGLEPETPLTDFAIGLIAGLPAAILVAAFGPWAG